MHLEFHQLDRRWEHLRVREPQRQRRLLASLADIGQQTPIIVVAAGPPDRYLVIDGYKRVAALEQLGRDTARLHVSAYARNGYPAEFNVQLPVTGRARTSESSVAAGSADGR